MQYLLLAACLVATPVMAGEFSPLIQLNKSAPPGHPRVWAPAFMPYGPAYRQPIYYGSYYPYTGYGGAPYSGVTITIPGGYGRGYGGGSFRGRRK